MNQQREKSGDVLQEEFQASAGINVPQDKRRDCFTALYQQGSYFGGSMNDGGSAACFGFCPKYLILETIIIIVISLLSPVSY